MMKIKNIRNIRNYTDNTIKGLFMEYKNDDGVGLRMNYFGNRGAPEEYPPANSFATIEGREICPTSFYCRIFVL